MCFGWKRGLGLRKEKRWREGASSEGVGCVFRVEEGVGFKEEEKTEAARGREGVCARSVASVLLAVL